MAILLEDMKKGMSDKVAKQVVDTFIRKSEILEMLPFDNAVAQGGVGSTLTYGYMQKSHPATADFRAINSEYTDSEAKVTKKSVDLKVFGGSFALDRVIKDAEGMYNNMALQLEEKITAVVGTFHNAIINGDSAVNSDSFDGLNKFLAGTKSEKNKDKVLDISTIELLKKNADEFYEMLLNLITSCNADALLLNQQAKTKIQTVARILGYKTESELAFGRVVTSIGEGKVRLIDLGNVYNASGVGTTIIKTADKTVGGVASTGLTDIYAVKFGTLDGFHGVTLTGNKAIRQYLPDFSKPGAVKRGEVEMVGAVALKNTNSASVLRNIKVL